MASISEKIAYLKGLLSAVKVDDANQKKVFDAILEILEGLDSDLSEVAENLDNVDQHLLEVDEDLGVVESVLFDDDCDCGCDCDCDDHDCDCCDEDEDDYEELDDEDYEPDMYEVECPACHETIYLEESVILDGNVECPSCGEELEFDIEFDD